jgi:transmembrane 9 superfamily protein 2/4
MLQDNGTCQTLCNIDIPAKDVAFINERIREEYAINWIVDGLPAASWQQVRWFMRLFHLFERDFSYLSGKDLDTLEEFYDMGFSLGSNGRTTGGGPVMNNHYEIILQSVLMSCGIFERHVLNRS